MTFTLTINIRSSSQLSADPQSATKENTKGKIQSGDQIHIQIGESSEYARKSTLKRATSLPKTKDPAEFYTLQYFPNSKNIFYLFCLV